MPPRFTDHALKRMAMRGITPDQVEQVLRRPIGPRMPGSRPDTMVVSGHADGVGILKLVVSAADEDLVVTLFWGT